MFRTHYVNEVTPELDGQTVELAGWVHEYRVLGKINFIVLRDKTGTVQLTFKEPDSSAELIEKSRKLIKETSIAIRGVVKKSKIASSGIEVYPVELRVLGEVEEKVPLDVTEKTPAEIDVRLDNRFIDLRTQKTTSIFKVRHFVLKAFRDQLLKDGFQEINPPSIVGTSTEGGTDLFPIEYFEKKAFLAQSPQLYKQLAVLGGMDKVFMITPVFRAEKHNTTEHLNEVTQMDAEMGFAEAEDALIELEKVFLNILKEVKNNCSKELDYLNSSFEIPNKIPRFTYTQVLEKLSEKGIKLEWGEDFSKEIEHELPSVLGKELFFITHWPTKARAFYSQPLDDKTCLAYDLVFKGVEMASGAQRIHDPKVLIKALEDKGLNPESFESYINAFRFGAVPHAGWSIGTDRITMALTSQKNIRETALFPRDRNRITP
ncbi:aspartate--tRNA(Asn) ligase [Candidatus Micrarchaeota archaeon]|nr:aspartate--tRNA(Asn) ligase [Candidatus Micrarchaeota archaeon]